MRNAACQLSSAADFLKIIPVLQGGGVLYYQMENKSLCCLEYILAFLLLFYFTWGKKNKHPNSESGEEAEQDLPCVSQIITFLPFVCFMKRLQTKVLLEAQNSFTDKYNKAIFSRQLFLFRTRTEEHYLTLFGAISILLRYFWVNLVSALIYKLKLFTVFATHWNSYWGAKSEDELPSVHLFFAHSPGQRASHGLTESWKVLGWRGPERSFHSNPLATGRDATPLARSLRAPSSLA